MIVSKIAVGVDIEAWNLVIASSVHRDVCIWLV